LGRLAIADLQRYIRRKIHVSTKSREEKCLLRDPEGARD
jgi:hypothetical protein